MLSDEEREALRNFKSEYETCDHYSSDLIIELDDAEIVLNLIEKQQKEIELLKEENEKYKNPPFFDEDKYTENDKIKAKIGERMQKNNNIIHNAKLKYGKDYVYYDDVQEAKEENRICKEILQSLLEKE